MKLQNSTGFASMNLHEFSSVSQDYIPDDGPIFGLHCAALSKLGLIVIPTGGDDGKKPLVKFPKRHYSPATAQRLARRYTNENIAILTGIGSCRLTVIDIDDIKLLPRMIDRFGDTPVQVATPKGGVHMYYRHSGEGCYTGLDGLKVDVRGAGGIIIAPPSVRRCAPYKGQAYTFIKGSWSDLKNLPPIKSGSLIRDDRKPTGTLHTVENGTRNDRLFSRLMREARHCDDLQTLQDVALTLNGQIPEPLPESEALKVAESAWGYEEAGKNWCGGGGIIPVRRDALSLMRHSPDGTLLYLELLGAHTEPGKAFAVSPEGMQKAQYFPKWSVKRYRAARQELLDAGLLALVRKGGRHGNDPSMYRLA